MSLTIATAADGVARTAHYVVPTGQTQPIRTLLLEPQRTNLALRSEEFGDASWTKTSSTVTDNATTAPDGATTADLITPSASANGRVRQTITFTGDGTKCVAWFLKAGTSLQSRLDLRDNTAASNRARLTVTWAAGVPSVAVNEGTGTLYPVESLGGGWYRILFAVDSVVAANSNEISLYPDNSLGTGTVYAWGAQAEDASVPSSYIKTEATTVTRNADSLYFPFTSPPQEMTVYLRGVNRGLYLAESFNKRALHIGSNNVALISRFGLTYTSGNLVGAQFEDSSGTRTASVSAGTINVSDLVEHRGVLRADGSLIVGATINNGAEQVSAATATGTLGAPFALERLWLTGAFTSTAQNSPFAYTNVVVAAGEQTLDTMRQLAGVA